jgi:PKD repeat protein
MKNNLKTIQCTSHTILIAAILCFFVFSFLVVHNTSFASIAPEYEHLLSIKNNNLSAPSSVAVDAAGNMYITESSENRLHIFNSSGTLTNTLSGLNRPVGVAVAPDGKIYVGNTGAQNVGVYDTDLSFIKKLGSGDGEVKKPNAIAVAGSGTIYIADSDNNVIKVYSPEGIMINTMGGGSSEVPTPDGKFYFPTSVAIDESAQELVITDKQVISGSSGGNVAGARVQVFDLQGNYKRSFGEMGLDPGQLSNTYGVAVDSEGRIFATNARNHMINFYDSVGIYLGNLHSENYPIRTPLGIALGSDEKLYIASTMTSSVEVYQVVNHLPDILVTPESHDFGEINVGDTPSFTFTVTNNGNSVLDISVVTEPALPFATTAEDCTEKILVSPATCSITIQFSPAEATVYAGNFTILSNDPDEAEVSVVLSGTGLTTAIPPAADFSGTPTSGPAPLSVSFTNTSSGDNLPLSHEWDFNNDGTIDSTEEHPSVAYESEGTYSVSLTVTDAEGLSNTLTMVDYIQVLSELYTLSVSVEGRGTVTSAPAGIDCPGNCSGEYASGEEVVMSAVPVNSDWQFSGWSGACSGTGSCSVTMDQAETVTASFECTISFSDSLPVWAEQYILGAACYGIMQGYEDDTFRATEKVTREDMASFIIRALYGEEFEYSIIAYFDDVPFDHPSFKYVQRLVEDGITYGCSQTSYCPDATVNRAQMATFIIRSQHGTSFEHGNSPYFSDIPVSHWAFSYIQRLNEDGISSGYPDGTYRPRVEVNRAQMAAYLARAFLGM